MTVSGPLAGLRVLEVGHILAGPYSTMLLADLGADVIKIESKAGDLSRHVGSQYVDGHNVYFASINRNKRSVRIDLDTEDGQAELHRLVRTSDALLANLRGYNPMVAVEFARKSLQSSSRPTFQDLEAHLKAAR